MPQFIYAYHGGQAPESEEEVAVVMQQWNDWLDGLGGAVVNPGNPVGMSKTVTASGVEDNGGSNPLSGFTMVQADDMDGAIALTKGCPILAGGSIEVAEILEM